MAIHAVHFADLKLGNVVGKFRIAKDGDDALRIGGSHPGNLLPGRIRGDVFYLIADDHVPVNAADRAARRVSAADFDGEPDGIRRVRGVALEITERAVQVAGEFLGPVTLLAGVARRPQALDGRADGARIFVERYGVKLIRTGNFRFYKPRNTIADMTFHAGHPCVRAVGVRDV